MHKKRRNNLGWLQLIFMILASFLIGFCLNWAQTGDLIFTKQIVFRTNLNTYLLTTAIIFIIYLGLYGLFNRFFYASAVFFVFFFIYAVADRMKVIYRSEPILPSDLLLLKNTKSLLAMLTPKLIVNVLVALIIVIAVFVILELRFGKRMLRFKPITRLIFVGLTALSIGIFYTANDNNSFTYRLLAASGYTNLDSNINKSANTNGPMLTFLGNMYVNIMEKPQDYSQQTMSKVVKKYQTRAKEINKKRDNNNLSDQTLIFVLSESFSDPTRVPNLKMNQDPMPNIRNLENTTTSGLMMSSGYGGGTANMEYMTLTGLALNQFSNSLQSPYTQVVNKQENPINIANSFKTASAIHPYHGNFYNRNTVYKSFGFQSFRNIDTTGDEALKYSTILPGMEYISDESAYDDALWQVNHVNNGQFINLVTMQNHMPYMNNYSDNQFSNTGSAISNKNRDQVNNYAKGLSYTDNATKEFLDSLDKIDKPITVVWYGDHLPGIYDGNDMYKYNIAQHQTDYFVYSNKYARDHNQGTTKITDATKVTDPNGFIPLALKQMNQKVTPYYALLTEVQEELPAMARNIDDSSSNLYVNEKSKQVKESDLTHKQKELLQDYRLVQYDLTAGKGYTQKIINK